MFDVCYCFTPQYSLNVNIEWGKEGRHFKCKKTVIVPRVLAKIVAPETYVTHPKQILGKRQTEAFLQFKQYPQIKMGQYTFKSCKPFYIATPKLEDKISCCCRIHAETRRVFQSCIEFRRKLDQLPDEDTAYEHLSSLVNQTHVQSKMVKITMSQIAFYKKCEKNGFKF